MGLIRTNGLLQWSDDEVEQAAFWDQLTQRLHEECGGHIESEAMLTQSAVENVLGVMRNWRTAMQVRRLILTYPVMLLLHY